MKTVPNARIHLALVAMFVTLALVGPVSAALICPPAAEKGVPFHGTLEGSEVDVVNFPTLSVNGSGAGNATHLGAYEAS